MATRSAMDSGLHTGTEYDTCGFALGEWRTVRSFDPIRHRWVTDYAAPIVAKRGVPVDGDAQLERERLPRGATMGVITFDGSDARRQAQRERQQITDLLIANGPMTANDIAAALGTDRKRIILLLRRSKGDLFDDVGRVKVGKTFRSVWALAK